MREYHTFIDRNYLIYKAVLSEKIEIEELERLHRNSLNASALEGLPIWLQKWASYVCEYLEYEEEIFPDFLKPLSPWVEPKLEGAKPSDFLRFYVV